MALFLFGVFALLLVMQVPIAIALGTASIAAIWKFTTVDLSIAPQVMFKAVNSFPMMAIPFFILAGNIMSGGGISQRLVRFSSVLVGRLTGDWPMFLLWLPCFCSYFWFWASNYSRYRFHYGSLHGRERL